MNVTIRTRLTALYFVMLAAFFSVFVWISDAGFRRSIEVTVNDASSINLQNLQRLIERSTPKGDAIVQKELVELASWWPSGAIFEVADSHHNWIFRSPQFLQPGVGLPPADGGNPKFLTTNLNHIQYRIALQKFQANGQIYEIHAAVPTEPFASMAFDAATKRIFIGCRNHFMAVANADSGKIMATYPIGDHVDASAFDPGTKLVFNSLGEGSIAVFRQNSADTYTALASIPKAQGSKTMALDTKTNRLYVPAMRSGQFTILVLEREPR